MRTTGRVIRGLICALSAVALAVGLAPATQATPTILPRIINGIDGNPGDYPFLVSLLLADRLAKERIPVFEVRPGIIETDMTSVVHEKYQKMIDEGLLPVSRFGQPEDVAKMVYACCTGLMDYSAGQVLNADGGFSLRRL